ncbi:UNVERIFIED_CONTAM: hypothetical protein HDU68_001619 [Siphonaria sp. JEL0065]|nr:hypothetical protein HDU68_001619 [Siphonaria sp. JEL0065]
MNQLAVSTYAARIQELNEVIVNSQASLVDYTPVYHLASPVFLVTWTSFVSTFVTFRIMASSVAPCSAGHCWHGVFTTVISILFVVSLNGYPIPNAITSFDSTQAYVQKLHDSGVVDQEQDHSHDSNLPHSNPSSLPPSKAQFRQDTTTTNATTLRNIERIGILGEVDGMVVLEMEPEMEFVKKWAEEPVVVPGANVRPVSVFCESIERELRGWV